jgi:hypothetical protein
MRIGDLAVRNLATLFRIAVKFFRDFRRCTGNLHLLRPFKRNATYFQVKQVEFH